MPLTTSIPHIRPASALLQQREAPAWSLPYLAGGVVALRPSPARLSLATSLIRQAQVDSKAVAWICERSHTPFPPDLASTGIDLQALPFVRARTVAQALQAAHTLQRSGAFSLIILSANTRWQIPPHNLTTLARGARQHHCLCLLLLPETPQAASTLSLRAATQLRRLSYNQFALRLQSDKDRRTPHPWQEELLLHGQEALV